MANNNGKIKWQKMTVPAPTNGNLPAAGQATAGTDIYVVYDGSTGQVLGKVQPMSLGTVSSHLPGQGAVEYIDLASAQAAMVAALTPAVTPTPTTTTPDPNPTPAS